MASATGTLQMEFFSRRKLVQKVYLIPTIYLVCVWKPSISLNLWEKPPNRCDFDRRFEVHETGKLVFRRRAGCQPHYYEYDNLLNKSSISQSNTGAFSRFKKNEQELIVFRTDFIFEGVFYFHWLFLRTRIYGHGHVCCRSLITQSLTVVFSTILRVLSDSLAYILIRYTCIRTVLKLMGMWRYFILLAVISR